MKLHWMSDLLHGFFFSFFVAFEKKHGLWPCKVAPTKIIAGLGLSLDIDILEAAGATGDYRTLLTSKASAIGHFLLHCSPTRMFLCQERMNPNLEEEMVTTSGFSTLRS